MARNALSSPAAKAGADQAILRFVFGRINPALNDLPQRTTLERATVGHLKAGRHWRLGAGWLRL